MARRGRRPKGLDDDFEDYNINFEAEEDEVLDENNNTVQEVDEEIDLEGRKPFADDLFEQFDEDDY